MKRARVYEYAYEESFGGVERKKNSPQIGIRNRAKPFLQNRHKIKLKAIAKMNKVLHTHTHTKAQM